MYFLILFIIGLLMPDDMKEELGALVGWGIIIIYTIIYCVVFWHYNWIDLKYLSQYFTL